MPREIAAGAVSRTQVLGYRAMVHQLEHPAAGPWGEGVLPAGVRDHPPGRTANVALRVRGVSLDDTRSVLVHSVRGAPHLHHEADIGRFAAAMSSVTANDMAKEHLGPFTRDLAAHGLDFPQAWRTWPMRCDRCTAMNCRAAKVN